MPKYILQPQSRSNPVAGVTLIEVLVALLVLSVGLVGIASLNLFGLKSVHSSLQSSTASVIALDLEEWLWEALGNDQLDTRAACEIVLTDFRGQWFANNDAERSWLPAGSLVGTCSDVVLGSQGDCWIRVEFDITWTEQRLAENGAETFSHAVQVPCNTGT